MDFSMAIQSVFDAEPELKAAISCLSFDTTSVKTGIHSGVCKRVEDLVRRQLMYLPCRHHILELVSGTVIKVKFPMCTGIACKLFDDFRVFFKEQVRDWEFDTGISDSGVHELFISDLHDRITLIQDLLYHPISRGDYKELLTLCLLFLGETTFRDSDGKTKPIQVKPVGAYSNARWMSRILIIFKIVLFRKQYKLARRYRELYPSTQSRNAADEDEQVQFEIESENRILNNFLSICIWIVKVYVEFWFRSTNPVLAPSNDLKMLKQLKDYKKIDQEISDVALKKFSRHLWYLSETNILLALFDSKVDFDMKDSIIAHLGVQSKFGDKHRLKFELKNFENVDSLQLSDFVSSSSRRFFDLLDLDGDFFESRPARLWSQCSEYDQMAGIVSSLHVVNDIAERCIKQSQRFHTMTKDSQTFSNLQQIIFDYVKKRPSLNKQRFEPNQPVQATPSSHTTSSTIDSEDSEVE